MRWSMVRESPFTSGINDATQPASSSLRLTMALKIEPTCGSVLNKSDTSRSLTVERVRTHNETGKAKGTSRRLQQHTWWFPGEPPHLPSHVRLIGVIRIRSKMGKIPPETSIGRKMQKTLETKHGLEQFRAIAHRHREPTLDLPAAETEPFAQLLNSSLRMPGDPLDGCSHRVVDRTGIRHAAKESCLHRRHPCRKTRQFGNPFKAIGFWPSPNVAQQHGPIE